MQGIGGGSQKASKVVMRLIKFSSRMKRMAVTERRDLRNAAATYDTRFHFHSAGGGCLATFHWLLARGGGGGQQSELLFHWTLLKTY